MDKEQTVIGSYKKEEEAIKVIKRLEAEGYTNDEITLYTNQEKSHSLRNPEHVDVSEPDMNGNDSDHENNSNFWESIKDAFKVREDHHFDDPDYTTDDDLLHRYRDNLANGEIVVAVSNFKADRSGDAPHQSNQDRQDDRVQDLNQATSSVRPIAGYPANGGVQGTQPPLQPGESEATPPMLDDQADTTGRQTEGRKRPADDKL